MKEKVKFSIFALSLFLVTVLLFVVSLTTNSNVVVTSNSITKGNGLEVNAVNNKRIDYVWGPSATKVFNSKEEALIYASEVEKEHQELKEKVELDGGEYVYEVKLTDKSTNNVIVEKFTSFEELQLYIEEVTNDFDNNIIINNIEVIPSFEVYKDNFYGTFKTYELAQSELNKYIEKIEEQYGEITSYVIYENSINTDEELVENKTDVVLATDLEEYKEKVNDIYNEYLNNASENEIFNLEISEPKKVGEEINETIISSENGTLVFDTLEEAKNKKAELEGSSTLENVVTTTDIIEKEEITQKYDNFVKEFNTKEEALNYLEELKNSGYTIESYYIDEQSSGDSTTVKTVEKIDESRSTYEISKDNNYILIKQGSGTVAIWTENALTAEQQQEFINSYYLANNVDGATSEGNIEHFEFISGYNSFDLSYIANNWGTYTFVDNGNTIVMNCDKDKISHLNYGQFENGTTKYVVNVIVSSQIVNKKYSFDYTKVTKKIEIIDKLEISYTITKHYVNTEYVAFAGALLPEYYNLTIDYTEPSFEVSHYGVGSIEITDDTDLPIGSTFYEEDTILPPKTGVNSKTNYLPLTAVVFALLLVSKKKFI